MPEARLTSKASTPTPTATPSTTDSASHKSGMPRGTEAGIIAGVVSAVGIIAIAAAFWLIRRKLSRRRGATEFQGATRGSEGDCFGLFGTKRKGKQPLPPHPYGAIPFSPNDPTKKDGPTMPNAIYEMDSNWRGAEMYDPSRNPGELDSRGIMPELDTKDRQYMQYMRAPRDPMTQ